jgi:membrane protein required for colicin V production
MLTAFDVGVGILVLISAILATARGLTREVLSLATWAGSAAIAIYMWQFQLELVHPGLIADENIAAAALIIVSFIVSLIVLHLLTMWIADLVVDSRIGPLDRTLGFVFGAVRGILIAVVVVIFGLWLLPDVQSQSWMAGSKSLDPLNSLGRTLISYLPEDLEKQVTDVLENRASTPGTDTETPQVEEGTDAGEDATPPPSA